MAEETYADQIFSSSADVRDNAGTRRLNDPTQKMVRGQVNDAMFGAIPILGPGLQKYMGYTSAMDPDGPDVTAEAIEGADRGTMPTAAAALSGFMNEGTLDLADEYIAGVATLVGDKSFDDNYAISTDRQEAVNRAGGLAYDIGSFVGLLGGSAGYAKGVYTYLRNLTKGTPWLKTGGKGGVGVSRVGTAAATGGVEGSLYALTHEEDVQNGAVYGAIGGGVAHTMFSGIGKLMKKIGGPRFADDLFREMGENFATFLGREMKGTNLNDLDGLIKELEKRAARGEKTAIMDLFPELQPTVEALKKLPNVREKVSALNDVIRYRSGQSYMGEAFDEVSKTLVKAGEKPFSPQKYDAKVGQELKALRENYSTMFASVDAQMRANGHKFRPKQVVATLDDVIAKRTIKTPRIQALRTQIGKESARLAKLNKDKYGFDGLLPSDLQSIRITAKDIMLDVPPTTTGEGSKLSQVGVASEFQKVIGDFLTKNYPDFADYNRQYTQIANNQVAYSAARELLSQRDLADTGLAYVAGSVNTSMDEVAHGLWHGVANHLLEELGTSGNYMQVAERFRKSAIESGNLGRILGKEGTQQFLESVQTYARQIDNVGGQGITPDAAGLMQNPRDRMNLGALVDAVLVGAGTAGAVSSGLAGGALRRQAAQIAPESGTKLNEELAKYLTQSGSGAVDATKLLKDALMNSNASDVAVPVEAGRIGGLVGPEIGEMFGDE